MEDSDKIGKIISDAVIAHWDDRQIPFLLSKVTPLLKENGVDYKEATKDIKLKELVQSLSDGKFKVVIHPTQRAKIGLIPLDADYVFEEIDAPADPIEQSAKKDFAPQIDRTKALIGFLRALSHLEDDELEKIIIPTRTLVRLVSKK